MIALSYVLLALKCSPTYLAKVDALFSDCEVASVIRAPKEAHVVHVVGRLD